jgi:hypothetical protein
MSLSLKGSGLPNSLKTTSGPTHEDFQSYYRLGKMCNLRIEPGFSARFSQAIFGLQSALNL